MRLLVLQLLVGELQLVHVFCLPLHLIVDADELVAQSDVHLLLLAQGVFDGLERVVSAHHVEQTLLPSLQQVLL